MNDSTAKILAIAGSLRQNSFNKKLLQIAVDGAREAGALVTVIDLAAYPLPLYNGDEEDRYGLTPMAIELKKLFLNHNGLLISSPEYNSSISAALKNAIDWVSRSQPNEPYLIAFKDKTAALLSASPGTLGGLRGLVHLRSILNNIGTMVLPEQLCVPAAHEAFNIDGSLCDPKQQQKAKNIGFTLTQLLERLR